MAAIKGTGQIWNGPIANIYRHDMFSWHAKFHAFIIKWIIFLPVSLTKKFHAFIIKWIIFLPVSLTAHVEGKSGK